MAQKRVIVGIGEALVHRTPSGETIGGLAVNAARHAARLGYEGMPISRIGQDEAGAAIVSVLRDEGIDVDHIQTDPDLPTGRMTERSIAGRIRVTLESRSAFDNLQWDYDLEDIAQRAEAVIFGNLARRTAQARTTIDRFLDLSRHTLTVHDLTNQPDAPLDRMAVARALEYAQATILDRAALHAMSPGGSAEPDDVLASTFQRKHRLAFAVLIGNDGRLRAYPEGGPAASSEGAIPNGAVSAATVGVLHGLLSGWDWSKSLAAAVRYARFVEENPGDAVPDNLFDAH